MHCCRLFTHSISFLFSLFDYSSNSYRHYQCIMAFEYPLLYGKSFKVITWNINGLRSFSPQEWSEQLARFNADLVCVQETKLTESSLEESYALVPGYTSYFSCCNHKPGYSGVATYCREPDARPSDACAMLAPGSHAKESREKWDVWRDTLEESSFRAQAQQLYGSRLELQLDSSCLDGKRDEGRAVVTRYCAVVLNELGPTAANSTTLPDIRTLVVINVYCPHNDESRPERQEYQLRFYHRLEMLIADLMDDNCLVMVVGDFNVAPAPIDVADENKFGHCDSLARIWFNNLLTKVDRHHRSMVDTFRNIHPRAEGAFTVWNTKLGLRETNFGTRIDFVLVDSELYDCVRDCYHLPDHLGSDHCPVVVEFDTSSISFGAIGSIPEIATCNWKQFASSRKQQSIKNFFKPRGAELPSPVVNDNHKDEPKTLISETKKLKAEGKPKAKNTLDYFAVYKRPQGQQLVEASSLEKEDKSNDVESQNSSATIEPQASTSKDSSSQEWKQLFSSNSVPAPLCPGHKLPAVKRKVKKSGLRQGHEFWCCAKVATEPKGHPETRCDFFQWVTPLKTKKKK